MHKTYIFEANTTNAAIEKGLKELKVTKDKVDIKILDESKKSFFSILAPRVVKVEMTLKENVKKENVKVEEMRTRRRPREIKYSTEELDKQKDVVDKFLKEFINSLPKNNFSYNVEVKANQIFVNISGEDVSYLIGYRAETLNALQNIINAVLKRNVHNGARVLVDIEGYRDKRENVLEELAQKLAKTVIKTRKSIKLEPMTSYERKIIHSKLQENEKIKTYSVGKEPYRRVVIALK